MKFHIIPLLFPLLFVDALPKGKIQFLIYVNLLCILKQPIQPLQNCIQWWCLYLSRFFPAMKISLPPRMITQSCTSQTVLRTCLTTPHLSTNWKHARLTIGVVFGLHQENTRKLIMIMLNTSKMVIYTHFADMLVDLFYINDFLYQLKNYCFTIQYFNSLLDDLFNSLAWTDFFLFLFFV